VFDDLAAAVQAAASVWEEAPAPGEWAPRIVAEHIISAWVIYLDFAADALERPGFDWAALPYEFDSSDVALNAIAVVREFALSLIDGALHPDLDRPVPAMEDWPNLANTVEGAFGYVQNHGAMHVRQIREAVTARKL
jgi:hypothetical protein